MMGLKGQEKLSIHFRSNSLPQTIESKESYKHKENHSSLQFQGTDSMTRCASDNALILNTRFHRAKSEAREAESIPNTSRKWRSFDEIELRNRHRRKYMAFIDSRLNKEQKLFRKCRAQLDWEAKLWNDIVSAITLRSLWDSSSKHGILRRMHLQLRMAMHARGMSVMNDMKTLISTNDVDSRMIAKSCSSTAIDSRLYSDTLFRILQKQCQYLKDIQRCCSEQEKESVSGFGNTRSLLKKILSIQDGDRGDNNLYTNAQLRPYALFESFLVDQKFSKSGIGLSLDKFIILVLNKFLNCRLPPHKRKPDLNSDMGSTPATTFIPVIMKQISESLVSNHERLSHSEDKILKDLIEHYVFSRLGVGCYLNDFSELDAKNRMWLDKVKCIQLLKLRELDLPADVKLRSNRSIDETTLFSQSIISLGRVPHLFPSEILSGMLKCIANVHKEAYNIFDLPSSNLAADCLMPVLVYILCRANIPCIHSQLYLLENFSMGTSSMGSEGAYYIACIRAGVTYIMDYDD